MLIDATVLPCFWGGNACIGYSDIQESHEGEGLTGLMRQEASLNA